MSEAIRLHLRTADALHGKGDLYCSDAPVRIGQTPECDFRLIPHPDFADGCYAVIVPDGDRWCIIRQEPGADIALNGVRLGMAAPLREGDRLDFDRTQLRVSFAGFTADGAGPLYVKGHRHSPVLWGGLIALLLLVLGILGYLFEQSRSLDWLYRSETKSIYAVRADSLIVLRDGVPIAALPVTPARIGTGFVADGGYFVTARHCLEFWLCDEAELRADTASIRSEAVRWAIRAELDSSLALRTRVAILDRKGREVARLSSDAFAMDKSRDHLYECGTATEAYLWRSILSRYSRWDAELGDVAVARWPDSREGLILGNFPEEAASQFALFGYPEVESGTPRLVPFATELTYVSLPGWLLVRDEVTAGYSGGPAFVRIGGRKSVIGIVSRSSDGRTLIVPVDEIKKLMQSLR